MSDNYLECYRTSCTKTADPRGYNRVTHGLYCMKCAALINIGTSDIHGGSLYPLIDSKLTGGGSFVTGQISIRPETVKP